MASWRSLPYGIGNCASAKVTCKREQGFFGAGNHGVYAIARDLVAFNPGRYSSTNDDLYRSPPPPPPLFVSFCVCVSVRGPKTASKAGAIGMDF